MTTNNYIVIKRYIKGIVSYIPGINRYLQKPTGGTNSARYCYSVWLRHLVMAHSNGLTINPKIIAEMGPGDSIGVGLAGLIAGADKYYAFDVVRYANTENNIEIFDDLVSLFKSKADIPGETEFPRIQPCLKSYSFPSHILTDDRLSISLDSERLEHIRKSISHTNHADSVIHYKVPWFESHVIERGSVDMVYSQAVLEHVDDLPKAYKAQYLWLNPSGFVSHVIDFTSHGTHDDWDGHWTYSDLQWRLIRGNLSWLINRKPYSTHRRILEETGFKKVCEVKIKAPATLRKKKLAQCYRNLSEDDLTTRFLFLQYVK